MSHFHFKDTPLQGLKVIQRHPRKDSRGLEKMNGSIEIGLPSLLRFSVAHPDNGLGGQMKDHLGFDFPNHLPYRSCLPNIDKVGF